MIRDKIVLYKNYYDLNIRCYSCNYFNHIALNCPMVHFTFNLEKMIISAAQNQIDGTREKKFERKINKKTKSLLIMKKSIEAARKIFVSTSFLFSNNPSYNSNSNNFDKSNGDSSDNLDNFPFLIEEGFIDDFYSLPSSDFVECDDVCSIEKNAPDIFIKKETTEKKTNSEIKLYCSSLRSSIKKDKGSSFSLPSSCDKQFQMFFSHNFHSSFDKMKNYEVYFTHNNAESIIKNTLRPDNQNSFLNEINVMETLKKKKESFNNKFISCKNIDFMNIFTPPKIKCDEDIQLKIETHELLNPASSAKLLNKKLRQSGHKKFYDLAISDEKLAVKSKKILKTWKWLCLGCRKKDSEKNLKKPLKY